MASVTSAMETIVSVSPQVRGASDFLLVAFVMVTVVVERLIEGGCSQAA